MVDERGSAFQHDDADCDVEIVSPELPCGASWLANCLVELDVPIWQLWGFDTRGEWERVGPRHFRYAANHLPWRQALPSLVLDRRFRFVTHPVARFSHDWPANVDERRTTVLFVRDPRDALYSEWRRQLRNGGVAATRTFEEFLVHRYYHHAFSFAEYLQLFLTAWREALGSRRAVIVRFEDCKVDARGTLRSVARLLGVSTCEAQLDAAVERSKFSVLKRIEDELEARGELHRQFNRRGLAFEYKCSYTESMYAALGGRFDELCVWLGYQLHEENPTPVQPTKLGSNQKR